MLRLPKRSSRKARGGTNGDSLGSVATRILAGVFVVSVTLVGGALVAEHQQRQNEIRDVEVAAGNLAASLAQHADDTLEMIDTALIGVLERVERDGLAGEALPRLHDLLRRHTAAMPRVRSFSVQNAAGKTVATSLPYVPPDGNSSDRAFFQHHQADRGAAPFVGPPLQSRADGTWVFTLSRRITLPGGAFGGVALATIDVTYFSRVYSALKLGQDGSVSLITRTGLVLARGPHVPSFIGRDVSSTALFKEQLPRAPEAAYQFNSPVDGIPKIAAYKAGERFPIIALVSMGREEALSTWRQNALIRIAAAILFGALIWLLALLLVGRLKRLRRVQEAIVASEASFRALAENAGDIVARLGPDWVIRYISPSSKAVLKRAPEQLVGLNALIGLELSRRQTMEAAAAQLQTGEVDAITLTYETFDGDGSAIWLETTFHAARDPRTGKPDGVVTISRDVTERRQHEERLEILAATDGLTGLANRRAFDEGLKREVERARRTRSDLSLVLLDLDRFKQYNDLYGHGAGDTALFAVAAVVTEAVKRPRDMAARYGGEELALLLPGTGLQGAALVADRARAAVQALGISHAGNPPLQVATISCGVASLGRAEFASLQDKSLLERADAALYRAKRLGRNTVCLDNERLGQQAA
jgi:diguanylate cyclase (GGDEF)-like protein/PAS domain S-box-containing protein